MDHADGGRSIRLDASGELMKALMKIAEIQAEIVRRIYTMFAAGSSSVQIAIALNAEMIRGPRGGYWNASTFQGNPRRLVGVLNNPLYRGLLVWSRCEWRKDPDSGKRERRYRMRGPSEWVEIYMPDLRIVDDALAAAVEAELAGHARPSSDPRPDRARRSRHLLSGLIRCGTCGANYTIANKDHCRCAGQKGAWNLRQHRDRSRGTARDRSPRRIRDRAAHG